MSRLPLDLVTEFIELRNTLHNLNQLSWSFSMLNRQYQIETLSEEEAKTLIENYKKLINQAKELVNKFSNPDLPT